MSAVDVLAVTPRTRQGNRAGRSCVAELKTCSVAGEFGMKMLRAKFADADAILERLGVISRGPRKGQPRGILTWTKVVEGGWDYRAGRVRTRGTEDWKVLRGDGSETCIAAQIASERVKREIAEREAAWSALTLVQQLVSKARKARNTAFVELRDMHGHAPCELVIQMAREEFQYHMRRAHQFMKEAREAAALARCKGEAN